VALEADSCLCERTHSEGDRSGRAWLPGAVRRSRSSTSIASPAGGRGWCDGRRTSSTHAHRRTQACQSAVPSRPHRAVAPRTSGTPAAAVAFNPQPDPPHPITEAIDRVALNPQPLPPRESAPVSAIRFPERSVLEGRFREDVVRDGRQTAFAAAARPAHIGDCPWDIFRHCFYSRQLVVLFVPPTATAIGNVASTGGLST
jgi:hypothetical protein